MKTKLTSAVPILGVLSRRAQKATLASMVAVCLLSTFKPLQAQGLVYVDADDGIVSGKPNLSSLLDINSFDHFINDDLWGFRPSGSDTTAGFAADGTIFVAGDGPSDGITMPSNAEDSPEISQTLSGLTPNTNFDVFVVYWTPNNADWNVRAGFASNPGGNQLFNRTGSDINGAAAMAGDLASAAVWSALPPANTSGDLFSEDNRFMYLGKVGSQMSNGSGDLSVFIDDLSDESHTDGFSQRTWFDGLAYVPAGTDVVVQATLDRDTGDLVVQFSSANGPDVSSYSVTSTAGALDPSNWNSIATGSNSSLDPGDTWAVVNNVATELSEEESVGTNGFSLDNGIDLGDVWVTSPYEDVQITLTLTDAREIAVTPTYSGTAVTFGSLDGDDDIDTADFAILMENMFTNVSSLTQTEAYFAGDLNRDLAIDFADFVEFKELFVAAGGNLSALTAQVPEPGALTLLCLVGLVGSSLRWHRRIRTGRASAPERSATQLTSATKESLPMKRGLGLKCCILGCIAVCLCVSNASAIQLAFYEFEGNLDNSITTTGIGAAFESEGSMAGSGNTFPNGLVNDAAQGAVFDLTGGGDGGSTGGLNLALPVGGSNTGSWTLAMLIRESDAEGNAYLFDNRHTAAFPDQGGPGRGGTDRLILNLGQNFTPSRPLSVFNGVDWQYPGSTGSLDDGNWHHIAWTYDGSELNTYINGEPGPNPISTSIRDLLLEDIELGNEGIGGGAGGQEGRLIDNVRVYDNALSDAEVLEIATLDLPKTVLDFVVDRTDGTVSFQNTLGDSVTMDFYRVDSGDDVTPGNSLDVAGWVSLDDGEGADPPGSGWTEVGSSSARFVAEGNVEGDLTLNPTDIVSLGALFDVGNDEDITVTYGEAGGTSLRDAIVSFVDNDGIAVPGGLDGDYNGDGFVNLADYTVWRDNLGGSVTLPNDTTPGTVTTADYTVWKNNFGSVSGAASLGATNSAVPEPAAWTLTILVGSAMLWMRRHSLFSRDS